MGRGQPRRRRTVDEPTYQARLAGLEMRADALMRRWREVQAEIADELTLLQKDLEDLHNLHSNGTVPPSAVVGASCRKCRSGQYQERNVMDDINGTLTCSNCLDRIDRAA